MIYLQNCLYENRICPLAGKQNLDKPSSTVHEWSGEKSI